jgi:hypothetical protein
MPSLFGKYSGAWTQDEYQNLFDLVNLDLRVKAHQKITPTHRQVCDSLSLSMNFMFTVLLQCSFILFHSLILNNQVIYLLS